MSLVIDEESGNLLPGSHSATLEEVRQALVDPFPDSTSRAPLFERLCVLREATSRLLPIRKQWLDGSFVTSKLNPGDIDLVTHFDASHVDGLGPAESMLLAGLIAGHTSRELHLCDSFFLVEYPADHPGRAVYDQAATYWAHWFSHDRDGNEKGYVELGPDA